MSTLMAKQTAALRSVTKELKEHAEALRAAAQENKNLCSTIAVINGDLKDSEAARGAVQELLDACLSSDPDAKHSPAATAVRNTMAAMLRRNGWLAPMEALELQRSLSETQLALTIAKKRIEVADVFNVKPSAVAVSPDGSVGAAPVLFAVEHKTARKLLPAAKSKK